MSVYIHKNRRNYVVKGELYHDIKRKTEKKTTEQMAGIERSKDRAKKKPSGNDGFRPRFYPFPLLLLLSPLFFSSSFSVAPTIWRRKLNVADVYYEDV